MSVFVHGLPSSHAVPSLSVAAVPSPLQVPVSWHWSGGAQVKAVPAQTSAVQMSVCVQGSPSLHAVPSLAVTPMHRPAPQRSSVVQGLPSSQGVPSGASSPLHAPITQLPCVQPSPDVQGVPSVAASPRAHIPSRHSCPVVQGLPSSQDVPFGTFVPVHPPPIP